MFEFAKDYRRKGQIGAIHLLVGFTLILVMIGFRADYSAVQMLLYILLGIVICILSFVEIKTYFALKKQNDMEFSKDFADSSSTGGEEGKAILKFREDYADFLLQEGIADNSPLQSDTTQLFKNVLDLQKKRLDMLGIKQEFRSIRKHYTNKPLHRTSHFDGKYAIMEIDEEIEAKRKFQKDGNKLFLRTSNQVAHFTILDAKKTDDEEMIICPNCGNATTRENLIDGCDYCSTKFKVEDLGRKISSFSLRDKYDIAYAKFKSLRNTYMQDFILISFMVVYAFVLFCLIVLLLDDPGDGDALNPIFATFSLLGICGCVAALLDVPIVCFYVAVIFPALNISASFKYSSKNKLEALKAKEEKEKHFVGKIRNYDPLFSAADFKSNLENKLSTVIFAETPAQINAFAQTDLSGFLPKFRQVFDYDVDGMELMDFKVKNDLQLIDIGVDIRLFELKGSSVSNSKEKYFIKLAKNSDCKTQAICGPSVTSCKNCGASLSLLNGLVCDFCGTKIDLKAYDWVITEFHK